MENVINSLFDCILTSVFIDMYWQSLSQTVSTVFSLMLYCRVPPGVKVENVGCFLKIQSLPASAQRK